MALAGMAHWIKCQAANQKIQFIYQELHNALPLVKQVASVTMSISQAVFIYVGGLKQPKGQITADSQCSQRFLEYWREKYPAILEFIDLKKCKGFQKSSLTPSFYPRH